MISVDVAMTRINEVIMEEIEEGGIKNDSDMSNFFHKLLRAVKLAQMDWAEQFEKT